MNRNEVIKRVAVICVAAVIGMSLFACKKNKKDNFVTFDENLPVSELIKQKEEVYKKLNDEITISAEEAARGKTVENTKRTVNEYGITIYGKEIGENAALSKGLVNKYDIEDDKENGWIRTYTEYYSDAYGGIVYIATNAKTGGIQIFNDKGNEFIAGKKLQNDIEVALSNYRMGNAMAEAIDKTYKK